MSAVLVFGSTGQVARALQHLVPVHYLEREAADLAQPGTCAAAIPTSAYPTPAARPLHSCLDCRTTTSVFGLPRPDWHAGLKECLTELGVLT